MKTQLILASIFMLATSFTHAASVYQCKDANGKMTFSDMPCPDNQTSSTVDVNVATPSVSTTANQPEPDYVKTNKRIKNNLERERLERKVKQQQNQIDRLYNEMDAEIAALKEKKTYSKNNLAGAQWETSISNEMQAITSQYHSKIQMENDKLSQYQYNLNMFDENNKTK